MKLVEIEKVSKDKVGRITLNNAHLEAHEYETIIFLTLFGFDIDVIKPVNTPNVGNADFEMVGVIWEAKSPVGSGKSTIDRCVHKAGHQASNFVFDLRRIKMPADKAEKEAMRRFAESKRIKRMFLITKQGKLLDIKK